MIEIEKPKIKIKESPDGSEGKFIIEPLERGYGITIGNSLRRVLLSALPGVAVFGIIIEGVEHEFKTIKGIKEDVAEIILNLKNLNLKCTTKLENYAILKLEKNTSGVVTAAEIQSDPEIQIMNPSLHICTMDTGAKLRMQLYVKEGRGYVISEENKDKSLPLDFIAIDSIFTPVKTVNYAVEATRVGQNIDYDKLTIDLKTNGAYSAKDVISLAAKALDDHLKLFIEISDMFANLQILVNRADDEQKRILEMSIDDMDLTVRSLNCLKRVGIYTVSDLTKKSSKDMRKIRNLGNKSLEEIINKIKGYGLSLAEEEN